MKADQKPRLRFALLTFLFLFVCPLALKAADRIVIGISPSLTATLSILAKQKGYFEQQGIDAELRVISSGSLAVAPDVER